MQQQQPQSPQPATPPPATSTSQPAQPAATQSQPAATQAPAQPRFNPQQVTPVVQIDPPRPADEVGVDDVLIGSFALIGVLIVAALVVGLVTGGIFIAIQRWRDKNSPDSTEPEATRLNLSQ
jgi:hypothetical protein